MYRFKLNRSKLNHCFRFKAKIDPWVCLFIGMKVNFTSRDSGGDSMIVNLFTCEIDSIVVLGCHNREECGYSLHARVSKATAMIHWSIQQIGIAIGWQSNWRESTKFCVSVQTLDDKHVIVYRKRRDGVNKNCFLTCMNFFCALITVLFTFMYCEVRIYLPQTQKITVSVRSNFSVSGYHIF